MISQSQPLILSLMTVGAESPMLTPELFTFLPSQALRMWIQFGGLTLAERLRVFAWGCVCLSCMRFLCTAATSHNCTKAFFVPLQKNDFWTHRKWIVSPFLDNFLGCTDIFYPNVMSKDRVWGSVRRCVHHECTLAKSEVNGRVTEAEYLKSRP